MDIRNRREMHQTAGAVLETRRDQMQKILLIYLGIITALSLAASCVSMLLSDRIADTGGLRNMGLRSVLSTAQTLLPLLQLVVLMGLQLGYNHAALGVTRGEAVSRDHLFGGFRRFFPLLRAWILQGLMYIAAGVASLYASIYIFLLLPVSASFRETVTPLISAATGQDGIITMTEDIVAATAATVGPVLCIFAVLYLLLVIPMHYRYRLVTFRLIDHSRPRALAALRESRFLMHRNRINLLKLDLNFWWYYLLQALASVVAYGDLLLPMVGVSLPMGTTAAYFLFLILSLGLQFVTFYFFMNRVTVTYAVFYGALLEQRTQQGPQPPVQAQSQPDQM